MRFCNIIFAKHPGCNKTYIFMLPSLDNIVKMGEKIKVNTKFGEQIAVAYSDNIILPNKIAKSITQAIDGYWPLAMVISVITTDTKIVQIEKPLAGGINNGSSSD